MTRADQIRQMDDVQLSEYLCSIVGTTCARCVFAGGRDQEFPEPCGAMNYLHEEVQDDGKTD